MIVITYFLIPVMFVLIHPVYPLSESVLHAVAVIQRPSQRQFVQIVRYFGGHARKEFSRWFYNRIHLSGSETAILSFDLNRVVFVLVIILGV